MLKSIKEFLWPAETGETATCAKCGMVSLKSQTLLVYDKRWCKGCAPGFLE